MSEDLPENEFVRLVDLKPIEKKGFDINIEADEEERQKLAGRFSIPGILKLEANCTIKKRAQKQVGDFQLSVVLNAEVIQECVMTLDDVNESIHEEFTIIFELDDKGRQKEEEEKEVEFSLEDEDIEVISGSEIDLGEYVAEYLSLAMNPYPRQNTVDKEKLGYEIMDEEDVIAEPEKKNPFAVLKDLKHKT
ncbi:YceD family protein [Pseudemcibacter aquimaris]|uniref:YceD family protein n=1 Tax=Pseudemcibacter aquimaris TaxID=2857064 RepID=UPI002013B972|nr:DUF177 domain-containing protein [Pseudemcibacter aquimaris]MCC3860612.1 DUF177 domain-containing protein [Pseudemcibacter aquimaris]WDU59432.1 DUF177 domain-containing protein [Pseudemcibacter aquimaris]